MPHRTAPVFPSWYGLTCRPSDLATSDVGPWPSVDLPDLPDCPDCGAPLALQHPPVTPPEPGTCERCGAVLDAEVWGAWSASLPDPDPTA